MQVSPLGATMLRLGAHSHLLHTPQHLHIHSIIMWLGSLLLQMSQISTPKVCACNHVQLTASEQICGVLSGPYRSISHSQANKQLSPSV
jgi:hypothetical protein